MSKPNIMKKVTIHLVVKYLDDQISPWVAKLEYGNASKIIDGTCKARSENGLKAYAIKMALKELKERCSIEVFCEAGTFSEMVRSKDAPKELKEIVAPINQMYYVPENDLPPIMKELRTKL